MRRPAKLERAGALTPRDRIWAAIRCFGRPSAGAHEFSVAEIMVLAGDLRDDTILSYLRGLEKAGYIAPGELAPEALRRRREFRRFRLVRDTGVDTPRVDGNGKTVEQGSGRDRMWRAMRTLKEFDYRDLALAASVRGGEVSQEEAQYYIRMLIRGGYLQIAKPARYGNVGCAAERVRFIRSRNTGPRAPLITSLKQVMDGNTGEILYDPSALARKGDGNDR